MSINKLIVLAAAMLLLAAPAVMADDPATKPTLRPANEVTNQTTTGGQTATSGTGEGGNVDKSGEKKDKGIFGDSTFLIIMIGALVVLWVFMGGSRRKQEAKRKELLASIKKGDKVTSIGGIIGTVVDVREDEIMVKVDDNTRIKFARWAVRDVGAAGKDGAGEQVSKDDQKK